MANKILTDIDVQISAPGYFDFLSGLEVDAALDRRDAKAFDERWMQWYREASSLKLAADDLALLDSIREKAFKFSFRTCRNSEIAGRVSDDVELIAKTMLAGTSEAWPLKTLWDA